MAAYRSFVDLPGASGYSHSGGDPETRQTISFAGTRQDTGNPQAPSVSVDIGSAAPYHPVMRRLQDAFANKTKVRIQVDTFPQVILSEEANTGLSFAVSGVCEITPAAKQKEIFGGGDYGPGFAVELLETLADGTASAGDVKALAGAYIIDEIVDEGENIGQVTLDRDAVSDGADFGGAHLQFRVIRPRARMGGGEGIVVGVGAPGVELGSQATLGSTVAFFPERPLPDRIGIS